MWVREKEINSNIPDISIIISHSGTLYIIIGTTLLKLKSVTFFSRYNCTYVQLTRSSLHEFNALTSLDYFHLFLSAKPLRTWNVTLFAIFIERFNVITNSSLLWLHLLNTRKIRNWIIDRILCLDSFPSIAAYHI